MSLENDRLNGNGIDLTFLEELGAVVSVVAGDVNATNGNSSNALVHPSGIAVDTADSVYVSDHDNHRVLKFLFGSSTGSIVAGTGVPGNSLNQLHGPTGLCVDVSLNIYVVDSLNYRVMLWLQNAVVGIKVAGTGLLGNTPSSFSIAVGLFVDSKGYIYLSDSANHRILRWAPNTTNAVLVAGTGSAGHAKEELDTPSGIDVDEANGYLYVADTNNHRIQRFPLNDPTKGKTVAGDGKQGSKSKQLDSPYAVCVSAVTGAIYITDFGNHRIQRWDASSDKGVTVMTDSNAIVPLQSPTDIKLDPSDQYLLVSETSANRVWRFYPS